MNLTGTLADTKIVWQPVTLNTSLMTEAYSVHTRYGLSWWDSFIIAAAVISGCERILSEDLSPGQCYTGVEVVNPFL